jgi:GTP cyclohydrolase I
MKKKITKNTKKKTSNVKDEYNKQLTKKLKEKFSGIKTKNIGDGMMEISEINNISLCEDSHDHYLLGKVDMAKEILKEINS